MIGIYIIYIEIVTLKRRKEAYYNEGVRLGIKDFSLMLIFLMAGEISLGISTTIHDLNSCL